MKYLVTFTQRSELIVGAIVEASNEEEASKKARVGDNIEEFELTEAESVELCRFNPKPISDERAEEWIAKQRARLIDNEGEDG